MPRLQKSKPQGMLSDDLGDITPTQCQLCVHFQAYNETAKAITCKAYPRGIPDEVFAGDLKHDRILDGQTSAYIYTAK